MTKKRVALVHDFMVKLGGAERVLKSFAAQAPHDFRLNSIL